MVLDSAEKHVFWKYSWNFPRETLRVFLHEDHLSWIKLWKIQYAHFVTVPRITWAVLIIVLSAFWQEALVLFWKTEHSVFPRTPFASLQPFTPKKPHAVQTLSWFQSYKCKDNLFWLRLDYLMHLDESFPLNIKLDCNSWWLFHPARKRHIRVPLCASQKSF